MRVLTLAVLAGVCAAACASPTKVFESPKPTAVKWGGEISSLSLTRYEPVVGTGGMVSSDDLLASEWGAEILRRGGNAIDAAVATGFALAVTRPHFASIGGGGFAVFCPKPKDGKPSPCITLGFREMAPAKATRNMFVRDGKARTDLSQNGALASGVPGSVAGLLGLLEKYGTLPRQKLLERPIALARNGFRYSARMETDALDNWKIMNGEAKKILGCQGKPCPPGTLLRQPDLARVLQEVSARGKEGFYQGWVAQKIVEGLRKSGGIMTLEDLKNYKTVDRSAITGRYAGMEIVTMPPPSAGGAVLLQMLGYAERADQQGAFRAGYGSVGMLHALGQAMILGYSDRAKYFGDPDFVKVPVEQLTSQYYLDEQWRHSSSSSVYVPEVAGGLEGVDFQRLEAGHTTHFSVVDRWGNAVALTTTINESFGSGLVPPGTGIFMNNEMDDFSIEPGVPNTYGLLGYEANAIAPGKRPISSMTPTIVRDGLGEVRMVLGAAGGPRITTAVFQTLVNRLRFGMSLPDAVTAGRVHHQWKPNEFRFEMFAISPEVQEGLRGKGYRLRELTSRSWLYGIERFPETGRVWGAPDYRGEGAAVAE